jgi:ABC-type Mn2+/Zn2+ transport system permease subunit
METLGTVVVVVVAVALLVIPVLLVRAKSAHPWPAIVVAMLTSGVCYTVGGGSGQGSSPSVATVIASIVGFLSVVAAIVALIPRSGNAPPPRSPILLAASGIGLGGVGLLINLFTG